MTSIEALAMFLWMCGAPQSMRQADNRFERSLGTCSNKFDKVLSSVMKLAIDIIRPKDTQFQLFIKGYNLLGLLRTLINALEL